MAATVIVAYKRDFVATAVKKIALEKSPRMVGEESRSLLLGDQLEMCLLLDPGSPRLVCSELDNPVPRFVLWLFRGLLLIYRMAWAAP